MLSQPRTVGLRAVSIGSTAGGRGGRRPPRPAHREVRGQTRASGRCDVKDPIGASERIRDNFLLYLRTAFSTQYPSIEDEREQRLRQPGVFYQEPWIEPLPRYQRTA